MNRAVDVFKLALDHEVKAAAYYARAVELTRNDATRMLLLQLVDMEERHSAELVQKAKSAPCGQEFDAEAHVKALAAQEGGVLSVDQERVLLGGDMQAVLELAIDMENHAQDTYHSLAEKTEDREVRDLCLNLAKEEEDHVHFLGQMLSSLTMDSDDRPGM